MRLTARSARSIRAPESGRLVETGEEFEVLAHAEPQIETRRLRHDRDPLADLDAIFGRERDAGDDRRSGGRRDQRAERSHGCRLAGTVRTEEAEHLAVVELEGDVLERHPFAEPLAQPVYGKGGPAIDRDTHHAGDDITAILRRPIRFPVS